MATTKWNDKEDLAVTMEQAGLNWYGNNSQYEGAYNPAVNGSSATTGAALGVASLGSGSLNSGATTGLGTPAAATTAKTTTTTAKPSASSGGGSSGSSTPSTPMEAVAPSKSVDRSMQDSAYNSYLEAMDRLNNAAANAPGAYESAFTPAIDALYQQILNRGQFNYDLNSDAMYQQYRDKYLSNAKLSMMDTMGQAAALTGGYGSSYGQNVGQQAYDAQLQQLNDIVPELYNAAYSRYQDEGDRLLQNYSMIMDRDNTDYSRYQDTLNQYNIDREYALDASNNAYNRWANERDYADTQEKNLQTERNNNLNKLLTLAAQGYSPSAQEIADAGITPQQWEYYKKTVASSGGGGGGSSTKTYEATDLGSKYLSAVNRSGTTDNAAAVLAMNVETGRYSEADYNYIVQELSKSAKGQEVLKKLK